jgi:hypothetical protein
LFSWISPVITDEFYHFQLFFLKALSKAFQIRIVAGAVSSTASKYKKLCFNQFPALLIFLSFFHCIDYQTGKSLCVRMIMKIYGLFQRECLRHYSLLIPCRSKKTREMTEALKQLIKFTSTTKDLLRNDWRDSHIKPCYAN